MLKEIAKKINRALEKAGLNTEVDHSNLSDNTYIIVEGSYKIAVCDHLSSGRLHGLSHPDYGVMPGDNLGEIREFYKQGCLLQHWYLCVLAVCNEFKKPFPPYIQRLIDKHNQEQAELLHWERFRKQEREDEYIKFMSPTRESMQAYIERESLATAGKNAHNSKRKRKLNKVIEAFNRGDYSYRPGLIRASHASA